MRKRVICKNGFSVSIQAGTGAYCSPRLNNVDSYTHVELGFPSDPDPFIARFAEDPSDLTGTVYGYVPSHIVWKMLEGHGGIVDGECPPLSGVPA